MLRDVRFLRMFGIVVLLHTLWDISIPLPINIPLLQIILTVISWIIAFAVMNTGLKEISYLKMQGSRF